jgi:hypothetical protein
MIEKIRWQGWSNVYRIWNDTVQLLVLADVGPRIIWYGFHDGENALHEIPSDFGLQADSHFHLYGGHRLWVSPEVDRTYFPDNHPVSVQHYGNCAHFAAPVEDTSPGTNLKKELQLELVPTGSSVRLLHRIENRDMQATELAPWTPTMMRPGGRAILPLPPRVAMNKDHYLPVGPLTLWSFTDLADQRWRFGTEYIQLMQQSNPECRFEEQMTGIFNPAGWGAYSCKSSLFLKRAPVLPGATYPDFGCNFEVFTNLEFLELETLGPKVLLRPGEQVSHAESWQLFTDVSEGEDENWIKTTLLPLVNSN